MAFLRSGDIKTIFLVCAAALGGGGLVLTFKPYVANALKHIAMFGSMQTTAAISRRDFSYIPSAADFSDSE